MLHEISEVFDRQLPTVGKLSGLIYSRFRRNSLVTRIAATPQRGRFTFPPADSVLFDLYDQLHATTDGAVDPRAGARTA